MALLAAELLGCASSPAMPPARPPFESAERVERVERVQAAPGTDVVAARLQELCSGRDSAARITELAECFHGAVGVLQAEPEPQDRLVPIDRISAFLAHALARAQSTDAEFAARCAWLERPGDASPRSDAVRVEVRGGGWDDGENWAALHTSYVFSCKTGQVRAEANITANYGPRPQ